MPSHGTYIGAARAAGQVQQYRTGHAGTAEHHRQMLATDPDPGQLGDTAHDRVAVGTSDGLGAGRPQHRNGHGQDRHARQSSHHTSPQTGSPATASASPAAVAAATDAGADSNPEQHRRQGQNAVHPAAQGERQDAVGAEVDTVDQRTDRGTADQLEDGSEGDRRQQHRPPAPHRQAGADARPEAQDDRGNRLEGRDRTAGRPPASDQTIKSGSGYRDGDADPSFTEAKSKGCWRPAEPAHPIDGNVDDLGDLRVVRAGRRCLANPAISRRQGLVVHGLVGVAVGSGGRGRLAFVLGA